MMQMNLSLLEPTLVVASLKRQDIQKAAYGLMHCILFPDNKLEQSRIFSVTETENEISLILPESELQYFPEGCLDLSPVRWKALQVSGDTLGLGITTVGVVQSVSEPLAQSDISIFYLSTFETDFVFIPESRITEAVEKLNRKFNVQVEGYDEIVDSLPEQTPPLTSPSAKSSPRKHPLTFLPGDFMLASLQKDLLPTVGTSILQLLFHPPHQRAFLSYTETVSASSDEISLIVDTESVHVFPQDTLHINSDLWKLIRVADGPLGFEETGIVAGIASVFASAQISLFYVSTFTTDFTLVQEQDSAKAGLVAKAAGYEIK